MTLKPLSPGDRIESPTVSRRLVLGGLAAPLLPASAMIPAAGAEAATLQKVAGKAKMLFGSAVWADHLRDDRRYRETLAKECGILTPEVALNWEILEPEQGRFDFAGADSIANFAKATGKTIHGHSLIWHLGIPGWGAQALNDQRDWAIVRRFISSVMPRYGAVTRSWDVVNEAIEPGDGRDDGLRKSPYLNAFGPDYVRRAFEDARIAAPQATLFLNDYGLEYDFPEEEARRRAVLRLLERLKRSGAPIGGLGIQGHLDLSKQARFNDRILADFLNDVGNLGLQVRISELDVKEEDRSLSVEQRDQAVADAARRFLDVALANRVVGSVTCWGITDRYSWLNTPGTINRGLPYDQDFAPKPLYAAIKSSLIQRIK